MPGMRVERHVVAVTILLLACASRAAAIEAPALLAAHGFASNRVRLAWTDKSTNETGFAVERAAATVSNTFSEILRLGAGVTAMDDTTVTNKATYSYRVFAFKAGETSDYSNVATASTADKQTDDWDPADDTGPGASELPTPAFVEQEHGPHILSATDTDDWFAVRLTNGLAYNFRSVSGGNPMAELFTDNAGFFLVAQDDNSGGAGQFSLTYTATTTAWHYLRVRTVPAGQNLPYYALKFSRYLPAQLDAWDSADDAPGGATAPDVTNAIDWTHGPHTLSESDTNDWFLLTLKPGTSYVITVSSAAGDLVGELYTNVTTLVASDDNSGCGGAFRILFTPSATTHWLRVRSYGPGARASYDLRVSRRYDAWDLADNINFGASALAAPTFAEQSHGPHRVGGAIDVADWFIVNLETGKCYNFNSIGGCGNPRVELRDSGGTVLAADDDSGGAQQFSMTFSNAWGDGSYYVAVLAHSEVAEYELKYSLCSDAWDPGDDSRPGATALGEPPLAAVLHGPHKLSACDAADWFEFSLTAGKRYYFQGAAADGDTIAELADDTGEPIADDDDSGGDRQFSISYTPTNSGAYTLAVRAWNRALPATYRLRYGRALDGDNDRMSDDWETDWFGSTTNASANTDFDEEGVPDVWEYVAGTDPTDTNSFLYIESAARSAATNVVIRWPGVSNRLYNVERATSIAGPYTVLASNVAAIAPDTTVTAAAPAATLNFYRLGVRHTQP